MSFISSAYAGAQQGSGMVQFLFPFILIVAFYFLLVRPQQKRSKEQKAMMESLQKGDEIVTTGGQLGRVVKIGDNYLGIEVADNVVVQIQKTAVQSVLPKGTIKSL
jgi:preprotein translocase subunit YajC